MAEDDLFGFARRALDGLERRLEKVGGVKAARSVASMRIARYDRRAAMAYSRHVSDVEDQLGRAGARWFEEVLLETARSEPSIAANLASAVADTAGEVDDLRRYTTLVKRVLTEHASAAPLVARTAPNLFRTMRSEALWSFVAEGLRLYDESPARAESFLRRESWRGVRHARELRSGVALADVQQVLGLYAKSHCGRDVEIQGVPGSTRGRIDGHRLHLPTLVNGYGDDRDFLVYRVSTALNVGHVEFGTFDLRLDGVEGPWVERVRGETDHERLFRSFDNRALARDLFRVLEERRIEGQVRGTYPGISRDLNRLRDEPLHARPDPRQLSPADQLVEALVRHGRGMSAPKPLDPRVAAALPPLRVRMSDIVGMQSTVQDVAEALPLFYEAAMGLVDPQKQDEYEGPQEDPESGGVDFDDMRDEDRAIEEAAHQVAESREQELSEARDWVRQQEPPGTPEEVDDWLDGLELITGEGNIPFRPSDRETFEEGESFDEGPDPVYPEWDNEIDDFRPRWVRVIEHKVERDESGFVARVKDERGALIRQLRRSFEALRPEALRRRRGLVDGDEIDINAAIEAVTVRRVGGSPSERLYSKRIRSIRDVSVAFLVDLSSSTNEVTRSGRRIFDVEKEALVCIAEAVDAIGDRFAVYGFSGYGRQNVEFHIAKDFDDPLTDRTRDRIGALRWKMENRDGAAIRHATAKLNKTDARVKLLVLLSDGRPLDCGCDRYFGRYAQEDTRMALLEARKQGVHPFCITVDPGGADYLSSMYGQRSYTVVDRVEALPARLPALYRRLTR